jgi:hypothetical protein
MTLETFGAKAAAIACILALLGLLWRKLLRHMVAWCRAQPRIMAALETLLDFPALHDAQHKKLEGRVSDLESHIVTTTTTSVEFVPTQTTHRRTAPS